MKIDVRATVFSTLFLVVLCVETQAAQGPRDDWRYLRSPAVLETHLDHSLTDAPLTAEERAHIYALVDSSYHDYFGDDHEKQRLAVLSSRVGTIVLTADRTHQILVRGPLEFCGGTGNCPFWILVRQHGKLRTVLAAEGKEILPRNIIYQGFRDLVIPFHMSGFETSFSVYRWKDTEYKGIDCYIAESDRIDFAKPMVIRDCSK